jgi:hypothetical protein
MRTSATSWRSQPRRAPPVTIPAAQAASSNNIGSSSNEVMVTADGYQARSVVVSPVRFTSCGESGGCNLVFMVKQ